MTEDNSSGNFWIDWSHYDEIREAVRSAPEEYQPHKHWLDYEQKAVSKLREKPVSISNIEIDGVPGWVGGGSVHEVPWKHYERYIEFVRGLDELGILAQYPNYRSRQFLDAVAETNLLHKYCSLRNGLVLLDLGGGYGRLAEFLLREFAVSYVVVDAVALSLLVAPQYISKALGIEVNSYWGLREKDFSRHAFSVWPTWHLQDIIPSADILINIHSLQEMGDSKADFYLRLFDDHKKDDSFVFLKNNYKYVTRHWNFPERWTTVYENDAWPCSEGLVDGVWQDAARTWVKIFR